jgi:hypothetical protein
LQYSRTLEEKYNPQKKIRHEIAKSSMGLYLVRGIRVLFWGQRWRLQRGNVVAQERKKTKAGKRILDDRNFTCTPFTKMSKTVKLDQHGLRCVC